MSSLCLVYDSPRPKKSYRPIHVINVIVEAILRRHVRRRDKIVVETDLSVLIPIEQAVAIAKMGGKGVIHINVQKVIVGIVHFKEVALLIKKMVFKKTVLSKLQMTQPMSLAN